MTDGPPKIAALNLSTLRLNADMSEVQGDHELDAGEIPMSPRAASEAMLLTPRTALAREHMQEQRHAGATFHGHGHVSIATTGSLTASLGSESVVWLWDNAGMQLGSCELKVPKVKTNLANPKPWLGFDASGRSLAVLIPGAALWLCVLEGDTVESQMLSTSAKICWAGWSPIHPNLLAAGSEGGRIFIYSSSTGELVSQKDGKHPGPSRSVHICCGDWLRDGRLAVASDMRLKVSEPITEDAQWSTFSKFYIGKMVQKIPTKQVTTGKPPYDSTPGFVAISQGSPPYIAMTLGDKVVTIMDYSGVFREEGFFIPLDYGSIVGCVWIKEEVLLIGLSNGYVVAVSAPTLMQQRKNRAAQHPERLGGQDAAALPHAKAIAKAMSTLRVFEGYLSQLTLVDGMPALLGDSSLKILQIDVENWGESGFISIAADIFIEDFEADVGVNLSELSSAAVPPSGSMPGMVKVVASSTDGSIHSLMIPSGAAMMGA